MDAVLEVVQAHASRTLDELLDAREERHSPYFGGSHRVGALLDSPWLSDAGVERLTRYYVGRAREDLLEVLANNVTTAPRRLSELCTHPTLDVSSAALANPSTPYASVVAHGDNEYLSHPECSAEKLAQVVYDAPTLVLGDLFLEQHAALQRVFAHPNLPRRARERALRRSDLTGVLTLLTNPSTTHAEAMGVFARDHGRARGIRTLGWNVWAGHPNADPTWLRRHWNQNQSSELERALGHNPATPEGLIHFTYTGTPGPGYSISALTAYARRSQGSQAQWLTQAWVPDTVWRPFKLGRLPDLGVYTFVARHAQTSNAARVLLALAPTWSGTLGDWLAVGEGIVS